MEIMKKMKFKKCPGCGLRIEIKNEADSWECRHCGTGTLVLRCPECKMWLVKEYKTEKPPIMECLACQTFIST